MINISSMDWGTITPEFFNRQGNSAVHIFNHYLIGEENVNRAIKFAIGRVNWYKDFLPAGCKHEIVFDDRGQNIDDTVRNRIVESFSKMSVSVYVRFLSKER